MCLHSALAEVLLSLNAIAIGVGVRPRVLGTQESWNLMGKIGLCIYAGVLVVNAPRGLPELNNVSSQQPPELTPSVWAAKYHQPIAA